MSHVDHPGLGGPRLRAYLVARDDGVRSVRVTGAVDHATTPVLRAAMRSAITRPGPFTRLVVDLAPAWEVSPLAAVAVLTDARRLARSRGVGVTVEHAPSAVRRALLRTRVDGDRPLGVRRGGTVHLD